MADDTGRPASRERPATPWWVKVIGVGLLVVLILAAIILVVGGGRHGPGMHGAAAGLPPVAIAMSHLYAPAQ
ncbi:MAG: hypothetical protein ACRDGJ_02505 [Candidatus Limnocylindria bacterium]